MAHSKSAEKRIRQNLTARLRNRRRKLVIKDGIRGFEEALTAGKLDDAAKQLRAVSRRLDQVAAKGAIHKNTAARKKGRLAKRLAKLQKAGAK